MSDTRNNDLTFSVQSVKQNSDLLATMRDDVAVLTAICQRLDATVGTLLREVRAMHSQHSRFANRVRNLESTAT